MKYVCLMILISFPKHQCDEFQSQLGHIRPKTDQQTQAAAVKGLLKRIIPEHESKFTIEVDPAIGPELKDTYRIEKISANEIKITGTSGVAAASGFHHYLKYYCFCHISWEASQLNLPVTLPEVNLTATSNDRFRYYQNVCTTSYSFVWWGWSQWEKHIDWMALNSFNLVLASNGQEAIWRKVYRQIGLTESEIDEHFSGPAFLSWNRMGNIRGWGGPLSEPWHAHSLILQNKIVRRMRDFGMITILPAFTGHVPVAFKRIYPNVTMNRMNNWMNFESKYCCPYIIDPLDPMFIEIGNLFLSELITAFGTDHVYNCDTFNEMPPAQTDLTYLRDIGEAIYSSMKNVDSDAIWLLQGWAFYNERYYWNSSRIQTFVRSVPLGRMLILDLFSEQQPLYEKFDSYFGQPYIWCMLHNFGGTLGMFGSAEIINQEVFKARSANGSTLIGTGLTPEGINQNYVIYDLMTEMAWRKVPCDLNDWFYYYAIRRYGKNDRFAAQAWNILKRTVYNFNDPGHRIMGMYVFNTRPSSGINPYFWYHTEDFKNAWSLLIQAADNLNNSKTYQHDLTDVTRQFLQNLADEYYLKLMLAFRMQNINMFQTFKIKFLKVIKDIELILATNEAFLLGVWLNSATAAATTPTEEKTYLLNAKNQITLWGPRGEIADYANKQWSGVVSDFFLPRWTTFLRFMYTSLRNKTPFLENLVVGYIAAIVEKKFVNSNKTYPDEPTGNTIQVAREIYDRWFNNSNDSEDDQNQKNEKGVRVV